MSKFFCSVSQSGEQAFLSNPPEDNRLYFVQGSSGNYLVVNGVKYEGGGAGSDTIDGLYEDLNVYVFDNGAIISSDSDEINVPDADGGNLKYCYIGNKVTALSESRGFEGCTELQAVEIPDTVGFVFKGSFSGCSSLKTVILGDSIKELYEGMFDDCENLEYVKIGNGVTEITTGIIPTSVKKVSLGTGITEIPDELFKDYSKLEEVEMLGEITSVGSYAFSGTAIQNITIPKSVTEVGEHMFDSCFALKSCKFLASVDNIPAYTFYECNNLEYVIVSHEKDLYIETVNTYAFYNCTNLQRVNLDFVEDYWNNGDVENGKITLTELTELMKEHLLMDVDVNENGFAETAICRVFKDYAFYNCQKVSPSMAPWCIFLDPIFAQRSGKPERISTIGNYAFYNCKLICDLRLYVCDETYNFNTAETSSTGAGLIGNYAFYGIDTNLTDISIHGVSYIGEYAFANCSKVTKITGLTTEDKTVLFSYIGAHAFENVGITKLNFSYCAEVVSPHLENYCFANCSNLQSITLYGITLTCTYAFSNCISLTTLTIKKHSTNQTVFVGNYVFAGCVNLSNVVCYAPNTSWLNFYTSVFKQNQLTFTCVCEEDTDFADFMLYLNISMHGYGGLTEEDCFISEINFQADINKKNPLILGSPTRTVNNQYAYTKRINAYNVKEWNARCFYGCQSVKEIHVYEYEDGCLTEVPAYAFGGCYKLEKIFLPSQITKINDNAFFMCYDLKVLQYSDSNAPARLKYIGYLSFGFCQNLNTITYTATSNGYQTSYTNWPIAYLNSSYTYNGTALSYLGPQAFLYCNNLTGLNRIATENVAYTSPIFIYSGITDFTFDCAYYTQLCVCCSNLKRVTLENVREFIYPNTSNNAWFYYNENLETVTFKNSYEFKCEPYWPIFLTANNLRTIDLTETGITCDNISYSALFANCTYLKNLYLPETLKRLNYGSFSYCYSLNHLTIPPNLAYIHPNAFNGSYLTYACWPNDNFSSCTNADTAFPEGTIHLFPRSGEKQVLYIDEDTGEILYYVKVTDTSALSIPVDLPDSVTENYYCGVDTVYLTGTVTEVVLHKYVRVAITKARKYYSEETGTSSNYYVVEDEVEEISEEKYTLGDIATVSLDEDEEVWDEVSDEQETEVELTEENTVIEGNQRLYRRTYNIVNEELYTIIEYTDGTIKKYDVNKLSDLSDDNAGETVSIRYGRQLDTIGGTNHTYNNANLLKVIIQENSNNHTIGNIRCCENLTELYLPECVNNLTGDQIFSYNTNLTTFVAKGLNRTTSKMFEQSMNNGELIDLYECPITTIYKQYIVYNGGNTSTLTLRLPKTLKKVECHMLRWSNVWKLELPDGLEYICDGAFRESYIQYLGENGIPDSVTYIGYMAFYQTRLQEAITIPEACLYVGANAFESCTTVPKITIKSKATINEACFKNCTALTEVTFESTPTVIGKDTFYNCQKLETIKLNDSIMSIGQSAFYNCQSLTTTGLTNILPSSLCTIGAYAFQNCYLLAGDVVIPSGVSDVSGIGVFDNCRSFTSIDASASHISVIGQYCFRNNNQCTSITFPDTVTSFGDSSFDGNSSCESIVGFIPSKITNIKNKAFNNNKVLAKFSDYDTLEFSSCIELGSDAFRYDWVLPNYFIFSNSGLTSVGQYAFDQCKLITGFESDKTSITTFGVGCLGVCYALKIATLPDTVTTLNNNVFYNDSALEEVILPSTLVTIGSNVFYKCNALKRLTDENNVLDLSNVTSLGSNAFNFSGENFEEPVDLIMTNPGLTSTETSAFECTLNYGWLKSADMSGSGLKTLGQSTFANQTELVTVKLSDYVTTTNMRVFYNNYKLEEIYFPNTITVFNHYIFQNCTSLKKCVIASGGAKATFNYRSFYNCSSLETLTDEEGLIFPSDFTLVDGMGAEAFRNCNLTGKLVLDCDNSGRLEPNGTFASNPNITEVYLRVQNAPRELFNQCTGLKRATIITTGTDETVTGYRLLYGCTSLEYVEISGEITELGEDFCHNNTALKEVKLGDNIKTLGKSAFWGCTSMTTINVPAAIETYGDRSLSELHSITQETLDNLLSVPVTIIGLAFYAIQPAEPYLDLKILGPTEITSEAFTESLYKTITFGPQMTRFTSTQTFYKSTQNIVTDIYCYFPWSNLSEDSVCPYSNYFYSAATVHILKTENVDDWSSWKVLNIKEIVNDLDEWSA